MNPLALLFAPFFALFQRDGRWSSAAPLPVPTQELHGAVLHGKIYVAGGLDHSSAPTAAAFRYDPSVNRWDRIADLPEARHHMPLAVVGETLYAVGGLAGQRFEPVNTLWLYREQANTWEVRAPLPAARGASGAVGMDGRLIVVGDGARDAGSSRPRRSTIRRRTAGMKPRRSPRRATIWRPSA